ncbi:MAG: hypothetical protein JNK87_41795 [Bryobacterales bacterium]|nr:hypothetical protein [Bryobacterales bacterium]
MSTEDMEKDLRVRRRHRLEQDHSELLALQGRSRMIRIRPVDHIQGRPPEKYIVTYRCNGFIGVKLHELPNGSKERRPLVGDHHEVEITLTPEYPGRQPRLVWLTDIWHPNIERTPPRHVCTDEATSHMVRKPLVELILYLGEMVQYKRYHAKWEPPFPFDQEVATWVVAEAEPKGWVGPNQPLDSRPLLDSIPDMPPAQADAGTDTFDDPHPDDADVADDWAPVQDAD